MRVDPKNPLFGGVQLINWSIHIRVVKYTLCDIMYTCLLFALAIPDLRPCLFKSRV